MKILAALTAMALSAPALAETSPAADRRIFTRNGTTYEYSVTTNRRGHREFVGRDSRGQAFRLYVAGSSVSGRYGMDSISFSLPARGRTRVEIATTTR